MKKKYLNTQIYFEKYFSQDIIELNKKIGLQWFAAEDEGKTEDPTEHKLKKAREEGRVAKSQDLNAALVVLLPAITLIIMAPYIFRSLMTVIAFFIERCTTEDIFNGAWYRIFISSFFKTVFPITLVALISGVLGNIIQNKGFIFSPKKIKPDFKKISPNFVRFFKKAMFSAEGLFNLAKSLIKLLIIGFISYLVIRGNIETLISTLQVSFANSIFFVAKTAAKILIYGGIALVALSIPDYFFQKKQFKESLKMSKIEITDEYKELEGNPMIKGQINKQMQAILQSNVRKTVPEADVVITNPTHYAVAIKWNPNIMPAPIVIAKGADSAAQVIKKLAKENNILQVEDVPLARSLYANVKLGQEVPEIFFKAISIVLAKIYSFDGDKWIKEKMNG